MVGLWPGVSKKPGSPGFLSAALGTAHQQASAQSSETPLMRQKFRGPFHAASDSHVMGLPCPVTL